LLEGCPIVSARTRQLSIPRRLLVASGPFGAGLSADAVAAAIGRGLQSAGLAEPDLCPLPDAQRGDDVRKLLDALGFDARMRSARAVVVVVERLQERALAGSMTFEIATRARQAGVPAYAVTGDNRLDRFDARMLDLQVILQASSARSLSAAGRRLAGLV
jgi:glycerate 2-kinase